MWFAAEGRLEDGYCVFELADSVAHLSDFLVEFFGVGEYKSVWVCFGCG